MPKPLQSAVVIARLLDTEGFTDYTANQVEKFWKKNARLSSRQTGQLKRLDSEITAIAKTLTQAQRFALGKFVGLHKKMSFETGLRIGLQAFATKNGKDFEA